MKLRVDLDCSVGTLPSTSSLYSQCHPLDFNHLNITKLEKDFTFVDFVTQMAAFSPEQDSANKAAVKLISMMMNGVPLLDTEDYIMFSNYIRDSITEEKRKTITDYPVYGDIFDNLLNVGNKSIILSPANCWTRLLADYLSEFPVIAKVFISVKC
jgi:hypothetical protein